MRRCLKTIFYKALQPIISESTVFIFVVKENLCEDSSISESKPGGSTFLQVAKKRYFHSLCGEKLNSESDL